jgi:hypothetical protein
LERKAAAGAYLSAVTAAAARQDINALLQQLSQAAAAAPAADTPPAPTYRSELEAVVATAGLPSQQQQQHMQWVLPAALTLATRQLATAPGGKPQFAQALVELVLDQGIIEAARAQRAVHAVLQAYYNAGDYTGVSCSQSVMVIERWLRQFCWLRDVCGGLCAWCAASILRCRAPHWGESLGSGKLQFVLVMQHLVDGVMVVTVHVHAVPQAYYDCVHRAGVGVSLR